MTVQDVIALNTRLCDITERYARELDQDLAALQRQYAISSSDELARSFATLEEEDRLLQVGVVGRVKAGKSSLLNALIFNGENILPKAATPMTAALTTLAYGETFRAQVQFYSDVDLTNIRDNAERYNKRLAEERQRLMDGPSAKRRQPARSAEEIATFHAQIEKQAVRNLSKDFSLAAAHDQWQRLCKAGIDHRTLEPSKQLQADDAQSLSALLLDYVGADGRYMALTKSVDIFLPLDSLRHLRIIDTPGFNDPVQSREARTVQLLKDCDVVLVVSSAGQFLNDQDIELMSRITQKEGVQELYLIASQIDNQLYGSETLKPTLQAALSGVVRDLGNHMTGTLRRLKAQNPEIGTTFDSLIQAGVENILYSSSICQSLSTRFEQREQWDSGEKKAWENLCEYYADFFALSDPDLCHANLNLLANIANVRAVLTRVREQKDQILARRRTEFLQSKSTALQDFRKQLIGFAQERYQQLRHTDVDVLTLQRQKFESLMTVATHDLDLMLQEHLQQFRATLCKELENNLKAVYGETEEEFKTATTTVTERRLRKKDGFFSAIARVFWGGGNEEYAHHETMLYPTPVRSGLQNFIDSLGTSLAATSNAQTASFRKQLVKDVTATARRHIQDDLNAALVIRAINKLVAGIRLPDFALDATRLGHLSGGNAVLKDVAAQKFLNDARGLLHDLRAQARDQIRQFLVTLATDLPISFSHELFADVQNRIEQLEQEASTLAASLDRLQCLSHELEAA